MENESSAKAYNPDVLSCLANLSSDEVFTPPSVVNAMLDMLPESILQSIKALEHIYQATYEQEELKIYCSGGMHNLVDVLHILQEQQIAIGRVYTTLPTLNDVFLEITGKALRDQEG